MSSDLVIDLCSSEEDMPPTKQPLSVAEASDNEDDVVVDLVRSSVKGAEETDDTKEKDVTPSPQRCAPPAAVSGGSDPQVAATHSTIVSLSQTSRSCANSSANSVANSSAASSTNSSTSVNASPKSSSINDSSDSIPSASAASSALSCPLEDSSDVEDPLSSMESVQRSPYEGNLSAEVGEAVFDRFRRLLLPRSPKAKGSKTSTQPVPKTVVKKGTTGPNASIDLGVNPKLKQMYGHNISQALVQGNYLVQQTGLMYSSKWWQDGKVGGVSFGWLPKAHVFLILPPRQFALATESVWKCMRKDLGIGKLVLDATVAWKLESKYRRLMSHAGVVLKYKVTQAKQCYKCELFVARTFRFTKALKTEGCHLGLTPTLLEKVQECLQILDDNVVVDEAALVKLEQFVLKKKQMKAQKRQEKIGRLAKARLGSWSSDASGESPGTKRKRQSVGDSSEFDPQYWNDKAKVKRFTESVVFQKMGPREKGKALDLRIKKVAGALEELRRQVQLVEEQPGAGDKRQARVVSSPESAAPKKRPRTSSRTRSNGA